MDIYTIATREANRAYYTADGGNETKAEAYYNTYRATKRRGRKAEEILAAGAVSPNGKAGSNYVESQNGGGTYTVDLDAGTCTCPDHEHRGTYCKHLQAAELHAEAQAAREADDAWDPMAPDYEALGREPLPMTAGADSRDAAGLPSGRRITTGYTYRRHWTTEEACEYADYKRDAWL